MRRTALLLLLTACVQGPDTLAPAPAAPVFDDSLVVVGGVDNVRVAEALADVADPLEVCLRANGAGPSVLRVAWKADGTLTSVALDAQAAPACVADALEHAALPLPRAGTVIVEVTL
ncbi:MAG: hypothetical protein JRI25_20235 [Deltaproteobacteria bacterium]|nr:hypothetical protein [Deltaproteobacteria bacterium]